MEATYYLPINSECLSHYFGNGCILPSKYLPNKPIDIQNRFEELLFITKTIMSIGTDCCLELVFTESEINEINEGNKTELPYSFYYKPLPISRVKSVIFFDREQKEHTVSNVRLSTAFIPEKLICVSAEINEMNIDQLEMPQNLKRYDFSGEIRRFNSIMGAFALLKVGGEEYMNYSENYFSSLAIFNSVIQKEVLNVKKKFKNLFNEPLYKKVFPYLKNEIDEDVLSQVASEEQQTISRDNISRIIDLDSLENGAYIIAVLYTFGVGAESKKKIVDGLVLSNFKSEIKPDKSEILAFCYGFNRGYSAFNNKYKSGNVERIIKFELESKLDYYIIESLYQYCFNKVTQSENFPYLDDWCPKSNPVTIRKSKYDYQVLDVIVYGKKKAKVLSKEYVGNLLQFFFQKGSENYFKNFLATLVKIVHDDTLEELQDEISLRDSEILNLKQELLRIDDLKKEIERLKNFNPDVNENDNSTYPQNEKTSPSTDVAYEKFSNLSTAEKKKIAEEIFEYDSLPIKILEKKALDKGVSIKGLKKREIIMQLILTTDNPFKFETQEE